MYSHSVVIPSAREESPAIEGDLSSQKALLEMTAVGEAVHCLVGCAIDSKVMVFLFLHFHSGFDLNFVLKLMQRMVVT